MKGGVPISVVIILLVLVGAGVWFVSTMMNSPAGPTSQAENKPVASSTKPVVVEPAPQKPLSDSVSVSSPGPGGTVDKTFTVTGKAPGPWFSEAQFPVQVRASSGDVIGHATAHTDGNWQSTDVVPFTADVTIDNPTYKGTARLILMRDNPSGLPENDDAVEIPIMIR